MSDDPANPYEPPRVPNADAAVPATADNPVSAICIPPVLAIACTMIFWLALANALDPTISSFDNRSLMFVWSTTLILSAAVSVYLIIRVWPQKLSRASMSAGFVLFGVVFLLLEGDTSNGTDSLHMLILYGTLLMLPVMAFALTRYLGQRRHADAGENAAD